jgi:prephenate dehydrogenase
VPFERVAVVGLGLIGGSIALAVRRAWPSVVVTGVDSGEVIDRARSLGAVDAASTDLVIVSEASLVVLAAPVRQNIGRLLELPRLVRPSAVVTDVGSTKRAIVEAARQVGGEVTFVGGHPLAGATASGIEHASADLFDGDGCSRRRPIRPRTRSSGCVSLCR